MLAPPDTSSSDPPLPSSQGGLRVDPPEPQQRAIVPRRPLRLAPPRDDTTPRQLPAALNIFADVFDPLPAPDLCSGVDPRLVASRRRARRRMATSAEDLPLHEQNLWHWSLCPFDPPPLPSPPSGPGLGPDEGGDLPIALHIQLARVRAALYDTRDETPSSPGPSVQMRLASHAMNATLVIVALPVGAAIVTHSMLRSSDIRLSAHAMALVASVLGLWHG